MRGVSDPTGTRCSIVANFQRLTSTFRSIRDYPFCRVRDMKKMRSLGRLLRSMVDRVLNVDSGWCLGDRDSATVREKLDLNGSKRGRLV
jgi:hypothetical protein